MRPAFFILVAAILQTVVLPRLNFFGVTPDLFLVTVVSIAVAKSRTETTLYAAGLGLLADLLAAGLYINTIAYVIAGNAAKTIKEEFFGAEKALAVRLLLGLSAGLVLLEGLGHYFVQGRVISPYYFAFRLAAFPAYNLLLFFLIAPLVKQVFDGD